MDAWTPAELDPVWDFPAPPPRMRHVDHAPEGSGGIMLGSYSPGAQWCREPGTAGGYIVTSDPTTLYERVRERGADVIRSLAETDYGATEFAVRDPEGNLWSFGDYRGELLPG